MPRQDARIALPERMAAERNFTRASGRFAGASFIHERARDNLLSRLDYLRVAPSIVLDLGCGPGTAFEALETRFRDALRLGVDINAAMCGIASRQTSAARIIRADAERLPLADASVGLILANLVLPWCRPERVFAEAARVLSADGLLLFTALGPDSLAQVRRAWAEVDDRIHVHAGFDMHDVGDLVTRAGLTEPVLDVDRLRLRYAGLPELVRDLRAAGATNSAPGRRKTLTGPRRWREFAAALAREQRGPGLDITIELIFGQAWAPGRHRRGTASRTEEATIPVTAIKRRSARSTRGKLA